VGAVFPARAARPASRTPPTNAASQATGDSWIQFKAHYYLYAILFLIFDVEVLFLLPFARRLHRPAIRRA